jgi:hypothetical protein
MGQAIWSSRLWHCASRAINAINAINAIVAVV